VARPFGMVPLSTGCEVVLNLARILSAACASEQQYFGNRKY
jgi:hypothetical protein